MTMLRHFAANFTLAGPFLVRNAWQDQRGVSVVSAEGKNSTGLCPTEFDSRRLPLFPTTGHREWLPNPRLFPTQGGFRKRDLRCSTLSGRSEKGIYSAATG